MRLWTLHPAYLDAKGLVATWREALLAQKVLRGLTSGYRHHPQLIRFQNHQLPVTAVAAYLAGLADEAARRGYRFDRTKIIEFQGCRRIPETRGQLLHEWDHLRAKLRARAPEWLRRIGTVRQPEPHPLFRIFGGRVRAWEKV